ncbi:hypothetical protein BB560_002180 [Smittium megazygosporum]|uniref:HMG box domain-containing protein n=1 Tax=Smittium megazygosporum TaxID=133381 RepID=A0A2T9ZFJ6_9FUNG|nr:hypothetical protein BB560_002180 [Smittium megazygosporum]
MVLRDITTIYKQLFFTSYQNTSKNITKLMKANGYMGKSAFSTSAWNLAKSLGTTTTNTSKKINRLDSEIKKLLKSQNLELYEQDKNFEKENKIKHRLRIIKLRDAERKLRKKELEKEKLKVTGMKRLNYKSKLEKRLFSSRSIVKPPGIQINPYNVYLRDFFLKGSFPYKVLACANETTQEILKSWKLLPEEEKKVYYERARAERLKKNEVWKKWWENVDTNLIALENKRRMNINIERKKQGKSLLRRLKNPFAPKRPTTWYGLYAKDTIKSMTDLPNRRILGNVAQKWKSLSEEERKQLKAKFSSYAKEYLSKNTPM